MESIPEQVPLTGGQMNAQVVRIGETVRRATGPHSPFVHALLLQLERAGFDGSPRFLGLDERGMEILSYIEGEVPHRTVDWSPDQLAAVVRLMRRMHDCAAGTPLAQGAETVCHLDIAPWNVVLRNWMPVAFIDFDDAAPGSRMDDLAYCFWVFLELGDEAISPQIQGERMALLCDAYGIADRTGLFPTLQRQQERILRRREDQAASADTIEMRTFAAGKVIQIRQEMAWLEKYNDFLSGLLNPMG